MTASPPDSEKDDNGQDTLHGRINSMSSTSTEDSTERLFPGQSREGSTEGDRVPSTESGTDDEAEGESEDRLASYEGKSTTGPGKKLSDPVEARPYIHISPARKQVTPGNVIEGLFGFYRAGVTGTSRFNLKARLGLKSYKKTFEFIIHKPRNTKRFDFYISVTPYEATAFKTLAANVAAMYPESFEFEIVPFNPVAAFASEDGNARVGGRRIATLDDIVDLENLAGFEDPEVFTDEEIGSGNEPSSKEAEEQLNREGVPLRPEEVSEENRPSLVRWKGISSKKDDWMTLLRPFSNLSVDRDDQYRSPLSVLLEQAVHTDDPFIFQTIFKPRSDWTREAENHKRNLKMGNHGTLSAFKNEFLRQAFGTSDQERQNLHRGDISEQVGGSVSTGEDDKITGSRMEQIDRKQPTTTFDLTLRAACNEQTIQSISNAFTSLSGPYYGIEGELLGDNDKEFTRLCHTRQASTSGLSGRFSKGNPLICASPDELANFAVVPHTGALPRASRGSSGGSPDARSPLTATDEDLLSQYDSGMHIGNAETAVDSRPNIPIRLNAGQLTHHILRAATTGAGKTTTMISDTLSAYESFDGPIFVFDRKGGTMAEEYKKAHFKKFGNLDDVVHIPVPGPNDEVLAFPYFDIRPQLAAGVSRTVAVQEKVDRYNELLVYVLGREMTQQAFVAQEILNNLIKAMFDPVYGRDAWPIKDLFQVAFKMQQKGSEDEKVRAQGEIPSVSDETLELSLTRHLHADKQRFKSSIDAVMNRITKLAERDFIWRILNFVPEWDDEKGCYADQSPMFDIQDILASNKVVIIDTGDLRPASSDLFTFLLLDYIWSGARLRHRVGDTPPVEDGYVINIIIDEAAAMLQSELVRDDMIPDGREFGLSLEFIIHFAEQVKSDALDVSSYKEILRNINTKLIGKLAVDDELLMTLFHEGIEDEELVDRITSFPRGKWIAQLPDTGFMTDIPEIVTMKPVDIPEGHSKSDDPVFDKTVSKQGYVFSEIKAEITRATRRDYCLLPGSNTGASGEQLSTQHRRGINGSQNDSQDDFEVGVPGDNEDGESGHKQTKSNPQTQLGTGRPDTPDTRGRPRSGRHDDQAESEASRVSADDLESGHPPREATDESETDGGVPQAGEKKDRDLGDRVDNFLYGGVDPDAEDPSENNEAHSDEERGITVDNADSPNASDTPDESATESVDEKDGETQTAITENLTVEERHFLAAIVTTVNGNHPAYDVVDSMERIKSQFDEVDEEKLIDLGYLEKQTESLRVYYTVTRDGQRACGAKVATGEDQGDVNEKTYHKVMVEAFARSLARDPNNQYFVKRYVPLHGTDVKPDAVGYDGEDPVVIGEAVSNIHPSLIVKHYDDFNRFDVEKRIWIVPNLSVAWDIVRALANAGRIDELPPKRNNRTYEKLTEAIWGEDGEWMFVRAPDLLNDLD
ncbi:helicase HerA domain-containing protein [Haloplanus rubicundus]|uniref:DUF87 domain-containing protein n=1 Tax=Haloplanus rubicundus TaxID=1547898 RepID=A0A345EID6_9EURY|nr:DUF87 domain-containing protein [Haloplanus rubicundus]AXG11958.1 DUF87 domain-containing protein [Haloplanus rubicundus]